MDIRSFFKKQPAEPAGEGKSPAGKLASADKDGDAETAAEASIKRPRVVESSDEEELDATPVKKTVAPPPGGETPAVVAEKSAPKPLLKSSKSTADSVKKKVSIAKPPVKKARAKPADEDDNEDDDEEDEQCEGEEKPKGASAVVENDSDPPEDEDEAEEDENLVGSRDDADKRGSASQIAALPSKFDPSSDTKWAKGAPTPYSELVAVFEKVEATSKRLEIQEEISRFFRRIIVTSPDDLIHAVYLCCNTVTPAFEGVELGIGEALLKKAIMDATGRSRDAVDSLYKEKGDLGIVALESRKSQPTLFGFKPAPLTVAEVHNNFLKIAKTAGNKSQDFKVGLIKKMLGACMGAEAKYIVRGLQGKLRIGLAEQSVLVSLAHAVCLTPPTDPGITDLRVALKNDAVTAGKLDEAVKLIKQVYSECPSYDLMIPALLKFPMSQLKEACHISAGVPLKPMLAKPTKGVSEVLDRFSDTRFTCEFKYDGERAQIHRLENGTVKVFSRNSEDNSTKYPDVVKALAMAATPSTTSFILDSEVVAYSRESKRMLPFQILSTRARKDVQSAEDVKVQVIVCAFDLLYLNGESLLTAPLTRRRDLLRAAFVEVPDMFSFAIGKDLTDPEEILGFLHEAVAASCEGLMVKTLDENATYEPSKRSLNWLKVKKDYMDGLSDSLDLVVIGAFSGRGKRTGVFGAFLLACYDAENEEYQSVCKIGTGFSEADLEELSQRLRDMPQVPHKPKNVLSDMECDVWFDPHLVWEVKAADLSLSPVHKAAIGLVKEDRGIALRFPRFLRVRDDKSAEDATTNEQVASMYQKQAVISSGNGGNKGGGGDDDDDDDE